METNMIRLFKDRRGVSSLEYAVLAVCVVGVVAAAVTLVLGPAITGAFNDVASSISAAMTTAKGT
jgi:Flp pilus assembly pilin Flp